jgi:AcrR family transcriptional regulator
MTTQTGRLIALAFDPDVQPADDAISQRILDAALTIAAASGLRHVTMDAVAGRARVGRMTVYRRFGGRTALIDALAVRECRRCLSDIAAAVDPDAALDQRLASLFTAAVRVIREHPLLERLARVEPEAVIAELTREDGAVYPLVHEFLTELVADTRGQGDPAVLAELGIRLGASFVLMPESVLPVDDEEAVRQLLAPLVAAR